MSDLAPERQIRAGRLAACRQTNRGSFPNFKCREAIAKPGIGTERSVRIIRRRSAKSWTFEITSQVLEFFPSFGELHFLPSIFCQPAFAVCSSVFGSAKPAGSTITWRHRPEFWQKMDGKKYAMEKAIANPRMVTEKPFVDGTFAIGSRISNSKLHSFGICTSEFEICETYSRLECRRAISMT